MRPAAALLAVVALLAVGCASTPVAERIPGVRPGVTLPAPEERPPAPDATAPVLGSDEELGLADFAGDVVVVNFWASWCGPCRAEQPELNDATEALAGEDVAFLGVALQESSEANALAHEREFAMPYPSLYDPANEYAARFKGVGPRSIPTTILIDRHGRVAARLFGTTTATEVTALARLLAAES